LGTFDEKLLDSISNKQFNVSFITTHHRRKDGYELRHFIWNNRHLIKIPTIFYSSTRNITTQYGYSDTLHDGLLPNDDKINLFKSQFSIAIESTQEDSYFSEKLIDCLLTKTVPIYWGASNIGKFFDTRGMICFNSVEEFIEKINLIDENTYEKLKPYIEINFEKAKQYGRSFFSRIKEQIELHSKNQFDQKDLLWTIGILSIPSRKEQLNRLLTHIETITPKRFSHRIEIIVNYDDGNKSIGSKRQKILNDANGKYISFIDDDDMVTVTYISKICDILDEEKYDGVGFLGIMYHTRANNLKYGVPVLVFNHANKNKTNYKSDDGRVQFRPLNHLNPIKTEIARQVGFDDLNHGEDMKFSDKLVEMNLIKNEYCIEEVMYHYLFDILK
jgi:Glycosyltransferase family 10 (fucosyltransferase) C-term